ncbi:uncharacterized protein METZ01_LOCUS465663 [marine metagenome]|uniref:Uncharacterized protein n=1 Tax=marine metagenome TaxID=408172 RepID=A0A383AZ59_9ZZZZ
MSAGAVTLAFVRGWNLCHIRQVLEPCGPVTLALMVGSALQGIIVSVKVLLPTLMDSQKSRRASSAHGLAGNPLARRG